MSDEPELSVEERTTLAALKQDAVAPPSIEEAVVSALRRRGLLADSRRPLRIAGAIAVAALAGILVGVWIGRGQGDHVASPDQQRFMLLLYAGDTPAGSDSRDEYERWARTVAAAGTTISGEELADVAEEVTPSAQPRVPPIPAQPQGFFVIRVRDLGEARRIAATCPHLLRGGRIVLRRIAS